MNMKVENSTLVLVSQEEKYVLDLQVVVYLSMEHGEEVEVGLSGVSVPFQCS